MELPLGYIQKFEQPTQQRHEFEFQALCTELQAFYGRQIWTLPYKAGFTEAKIRKAHEIALNRGKTTFRYLIGIIRNLKPYEY